jgi:uncharacterized coiled-coil protein SlyX
MLDTATFCRVAKVVAPKKAALAAAEEEYKTLMAGLAEKKAQLAEVVARVKALEEKLQEMQASNGRYSAGFGVLGSGIVGTSALLNSGTCCCVYVGVQERCVAGFKIVL